MNDPLAPAMRRALQETRAGNLMDATRTIQNALNGGDGPARAAPNPGAATSRTTRPRRPLGETVSTLFNQKRAAGTAYQPGSARHARTPEVPSGARYEHRLHRSAYGDRSYRLFVPSARGEPVQGLIVMLHGCTQSADDFAVGTRMNDHAERHNLCVVYPQQDASANQMSCWNWFERGHQERNAGEPGLLADLVTNVSTEFAVPEGRTFAAGLSAGGAMAAILGHTYPDIFAAVGVHSGLARGTAHDVASAFGAMRNPAQLPQRFEGSPLPTVVFHGAADATVHPANADHVVAASLAGEATAEIEDRSTPGVTRRLYQAADGRTLAEFWLLDGVAHAWSGGSPRGSYTHSGGPDASAEMVRFFLSQRSN